MNKKHTEKLFNDFPEFFGHKNNKQMSLMAFGFACDDGWYQLIYNLCKDIKEWFNDNMDGVPDYFEIQQVKEKYASLRVYTGPAPKEVHNMIHKAEHNSYFICEKCGDDIRNHRYNDNEYHGYYRDELPWIRTLCDDCLCEELKSKGLCCDNDYISDWQKENKAPFKVIE